MDGRAVERDRIFGKILKGNLVDGSIQLNGRVCLTGDETEIDRSDIGQSREPALECDLGGRDA